MDSGVFIEKLDLVTDKINEIINQSKLLASKSVQNFIKNDIKILGGLIGAYHRFFKAIQVESRNDAEKLWTKLLIKDKKVEDKVDELLSLEELFDEFLNEIDDKLKNEEILESSKSKLNINDVLSDKLTIKTVQGQ